MAIDINEYLKDIDPDNVCGEDLEYDPEFMALKQAIKGKPEQQMGNTVTEAEPPVWREIKKQSEALLLRTIDLELLICYLRALIALDGFSGLQDGLTLIKTLIENRWDTLYPPLDLEDDNPAESRINILLSLCDYETILRSLQQTPLLESKSIGRFNFRQISIAAGKSTATSNEKEVSQSTIDAAVQDSELEHLQKTFQEITTSLDAINQLETVITNYVGLSDAPSFAELRLFLKESKAFLADSLEKKDGGTDLNQSVTTDGNTLESEGITVSLTTTTTQKSVLGVINNNQDVIKTLNLVCDYYRKNEPSSPVPLFVERAIKMVGKSFMDVLKEIAPTGVDEAKIILGKQHDEDENN